MVGKTRVFLVSALVALILLASFAFAESSRSTTATTATRSTNTSATQTTSASRNTASTTWVTCTDGDNGKSLAQKSSGTGCNNNLDPKCGTYSDVCDESMGNKSVIEVYCENDAITWESYPCPANSPCWDGRCIACTDSDNGFDTHVAGIASGVFNTTKTHQQKGDYCTDGQTLHEYICNSGYVIEGDTKCNTGYSCIDGACVQTGATCASEGQTCQGVTCCKNLACTKEGYAYICKSSVTAQVVSAVQDAVVKATGFPLPGSRALLTNSTVDSAKLASTKESHADDAVGFIRMDQAAKIAYSWKHGEAEPYAVLIYMTGDYEKACVGSTSILCPIGQSAISGTVDGVSTAGAHLFSVEFHFKSYEEAIALYGLLDKNKEYGGVNFGSKDCQRYEVANGYITCTIGGADSYYEIG